VACKHVFTMPIRARRITSSVVTPWGYEAGARPLRKPTSSRTNSCFLLAFFPMAEKKER
jgi:hypothetical protein